MIFVDSCYIIALMNKKAKKHKEALELLSVIENESIVSYQTFGIYVSNHLSYTFVSKIDSK